MKSRKEVAHFISRQLNRGCMFYDIPEKDGDCHHYGIVDLRELMDFMYEDKPASEDEFIVRDNSAGRMPEDLINAIGRVRRMRRRQEAIAIRETEEIKGHHTSTKGDICKYHRDILDKIKWKNKSIEQVNNESVIELERNILKRIKED